MVSGVAVAVNVAQAVASPRSIDSATVVDDADEEGSFGTISNLARVGDGVG